MVSGRVYWGRVDVLVWQGENEGWRRNIVCWFFWFVDSHGWGIKNVDNFCFS